MNPEKIEKLIEDWHLWPGVFSEKPTSKNF
jgi:hypothetical protein